MVINNEYNKIQINEVIDKDGNGTILKRSLMLNIRCDDVAEADKLYRELKQKFIGNVPVSQKSEAQNNKKESGVWCDKCGKPMELRNGKNGQFYGCTGFPQCRNTQELEKSGDEVPTIEVGK